MLLLSTFNENIPQLSLHLLAPISLNNFQTLAGLLAFSFKISEYCYSFIKTLKDREFQMILAKLCDAVFVKV